MKDKLEVAIFYFSIPVIVLVTLINYIIGIIIIVSIIITLFIMWLINKRMCRFLRYNIKTKNIQQSLSLKTMIKLNLKNNFKNENPHIRIYRELSLGNKELIKYLNKSRCKVFKTTTNKFMYKRLQGIEKKGIIRVEKISKNDIIKMQPLPKLMLVGWVTSIININNTEFWKYIKEEEQINEYKIYILKNVK